MPVTVASIAHYDSPRDRLAGAVALDDLTERLQRVAEEAFGSLSQTDLAERIAAVVDGTPRRAAYWLSGESRVPDAVLEKMDAAVAKRREVGPDAPITALVDDLRAAGLHDELIAAALHAAADRVRGRTND